MPGGGAIPGEWEDTVTNGRNVQVLRSTFLSQFKPADYAGNNETKLQAIKQGLEESTIEYYFDVMDLCRKIDPRMTMLPN